MVGCGLARFHIDFVYSTQTQCILLTADGLGWCVSAVFSAVSSYTAVHSVMASSFRSCWMNLEKEKLRQVCVPDASIILLIIYK